MGLFDRKRLEVASGGEWVMGADVPALGDGALMVRGLTCDAARDAFAMKARGAKKADRTSDGALLPSALTRHTREVLSETCILDARDLPFTADQVRDMVMDPAYEALITAAIQACQVIDARAQEVDEATVGNSQASSSGTPSTGAKPRKIAKR